MVKIYIGVVYPVMFYVPFVLVSVFSIGIAIKICMMRKNQGTVKGKIVDLSKLNFHLDWGRCNRIALKLRPNQ